MPILDNILSVLKEGSFTFLKNILDIGLVTYLVYRLLKMVHGTRAWRIIGGVIFFVCTLFASEFLHLYTLHWLLDRATILAPFALVLLLLPELRQTIEGFAKLALWPERITFTGAQETNKSTLEQIITATDELATSKIGGLIVIERFIGLNDYVQTGTIINAKVSSLLLKSIFYYGNPLHDGAVIIKGDSIVGASCRLPLSENRNLDTNIHTRHRAGVGITELSDAVAIIISEERGTISLSTEGKLHRMNSSQELKEKLNQIFYIDLPPKNSSSKSFFKHRIRLKQKESNLS